MSFGRALTNINDNSREPISPTGRLLQMRTPMTVKALGQLPVVGSKDAVFKILLLNPNSTDVMTLNCLKMVERQLAPDVALYGYTAQHPAPTSVEGHLDGVLSAADAFRDSYDYVQQADAVLVACFSDHPLTNCLREEFDIPVCGIFEAGIYSARMLGGRFGVVTTVARSSLRHAAAIRSMGLEGYCAGLESTNLKVKELHTKPREEVLRLMRNVALKLVNEKGADCLVLGCAGMADMQKAVEATVADQGVQVIDGVVTGVNILTGLVRCGLKTSKKGLFVSSKDSRVSRGQIYV